MWTEITQLHAVLRFNNLLQSWGRNQSISSEKVLIYVPTLGFWDVILVKNQSHNIVFSTFVLVKISFLSSNNT